MGYKKVEEYDEKITTGLTENYKDALGLLGEDPQREGLLKTWHRNVTAQTQSGCVARWP